MSRRTSVYLFRVVVRGLFLVMAVAVPALNAQVITTFDSGLEGWQVTGDNASAWEPATGNPGGCLAVNDLATGDMNYIIAPAAYHGDWSGMTAADSLSAEIYLNNTSGGSLVNPAYIFRIAGPGGAAHSLVGAAYLPAQGVWTAYQAYLDEANWVIESGTWTEILSAVNSVRITGEFVTGGEIVRLDNVQLSSTPGTVFIPCVYDDFNEAGTGDWSFLNTNSVSNPGSGGNKGGFIQIGDKSGISTAIAPAMFLGDWSSLDQSGYVAVDVRVLSRSGTGLGIIEFIRISGPGGSAYVTLDTSELPPSGLVWKTFRYPLDSSTWTVDSGTWVGLLANIANCIIMPEFFNSTETVGLDNFGRMADSCPAIDDTVGVYGVGIAGCGYLSLVGISSTAYNVRAGELYGLVRTGTGSGGGLYPVSGPGSGIRIQAYDTAAHLIFDREGNGFISEDYSGNIYRRAWTGGSTLWVSGFHSGDDDPYGMTFAPLGFNGTNVNEGDILVSDWGYNGADQIWAFSPDSAEGEQLVMGDPGNVDQFDLAADPDGEVYVCDELDSNNLYRLGPDGALSSLALSVPIGTLYSIVYDNVEEDIYVAGQDSKAVYRVDPDTGNVTLVAEGFASFSPCCLEIDPATRRLWVADAGYNRVYEFCLDGGVSVDMAVRLEGADRPADSGWQVPLFAGFFQPGADVLQDPALYYCHLTTNREGEYAVGQVPGVAAGTYDITAVSEHTLLNVRRNVVIAGASTAVDLGTLAEGNADDNHTIHLTDFGVLAGAWQASAGEAGYDSRADFDRNGEVNFSDLYLLCTNWLRSAPLEVP